MRGRHRIRKLIDGRKLCHETKAAQKAEKERRERVLKERENVRTIDKWIKRTLCTL
jgi:hypothetical protein